MLGRLSVGTTVAILTFIILVANLCIKTFAIAQLPWSNRYIQDFVHFFIIAITVLVVAVPEGLPLAVTISLAYAVRVRLLTYLRIYVFNSLVPELFYSLPSK